MLAASGNSLPYKGIGPVWSGRETDSGWIHTRYGSLCPPKDKKIQNIVRCPVMEKYAHLDSVAQILNILPEDFWGIIILWTRNDIKWIENKESPGTRNDEFNERMREWKSIRNPRESIGRNRNEEQQEFLREILEICVFWVIGKNIFFQSTPKVRLFLLIFYLLSLEYNRNTETIHFNILHGVWNVNFLI